MRFRSLAILLLVLAAAVGSWLMLGPAAAMEDLVLAPTPLANDAGAEAEPDPAAAPPSRDAARDHGTRELVNIPASRAARKVVLTGTVVDAAGRPARDAIVCLGRGRPDKEALEETGAAGTYEYTVDPGEHHLLARREGSALARTQVQVPDGVDRFEAPPLVLSAGKVIRGRVLDWHGKPMVEARVQAFAEGEESAVVYSTGKLLLLRCDDVLTDEHGCFEMLGLEDLPYTVRPDLDFRAELLAAPREVKGVVPGGTPLEFRLAPRWLVRGTVVDAHTGLPIRTFFVSSTEVRSDDGRFEVPIARRAFTVSATGYLHAQGEVDQTGANDDRVVRLTPHPDRALLVIVAKDEAGAPVEGIEVTWNHEWNAAPVSGRRVFLDSDGRPHWGKHVARDSGGTFRIPVRNGPLRIDVRADGHETTNVRDRIARGEEKTIEVRLVRSAPLRLRVLFPDGRTMKNVDLTIKGEQEGPLPWRFTAARARGRNPPFREWLDARPVLELPPPGTPRVPQTTVHPPQRIFEADGLVTGLPPGGYRLTVSSRSGSMQMPFTVSAGRTEELTLQWRN